MDIIAVYDVSLMSHGCITGKQVQSFLGTKVNFTKNPLCKQHYLPLTLIEEIQTRTTQEFFKRVDLIIPPKIFPKTLLAP